MSQDNGTDMRAADPQNQDNGTNTPPSSSPFTDILNVFAQKSDYSLKTKDLLMFEKAVEDAEAAILQVLAEAIGDNEKSLYADSHEQAKAKLHRNYIRDIIRFKLGINGEGKPQ